MNRRSCIVGVLVAVVFLTMMGSKKAPGYPRLSLHQSNVHNLPDTLLWMCDEIYGRTPVEDVVEVKEHACSQGQGDWAERCRWIDCWCPLTSKYWEPGTMPPWITGEMHENPAKRLYYLANANEWAGAEWFLKNDQGEMIAVWNKDGDNPLCLLNLSQSCPRGVVGDSQGLTVIEYMCGPWLDVFFQTRWQQVYDGMQVEDGPFPAIRCWDDQFDTTLVVPGPGMDPMTCSQFRAHAYEHYSMFITDCVGVLGRWGKITRTNGHFDYGICDWQNPLLISHAMLIYENFSACKLEHVGNWGGCPECDLLKWTQVMFRIEEHYHPFTGNAANGTHWDGLQGWDVACSECGVRSHWPIESINEWQRKILAYALMSEMTFNVKCKDNHEQIVPFGPHARFKLGKPTGPSQEYPDHSLNPVYYRRFDHNGQTFTVAWNPWPFCNEGIPPMDGAWFSGQWPDGLYSPLEF